jgi:hypothetical protein
MRPLVADGHTKVSLPATFGCIDVRTPSTSLLGTQREGTTMQALLTLMETLRPTGFWNEACKLLNICK